MIRPTNEEHPPQGIPTRPMGNIAVLARMVTREGRFWIPAKALRWTPTHVMVSYRPEPEQREETLAWLRKDDVTRMLPC